MRNRAIVFVLSFALLLVAAGCGDSRPAESPARETAAAVRGTGATETEAPTAGTDAPLDLEAASLASSAEPADVPRSYTASTDPALEALMDTATMSINGEVYENIGLTMDLNVNNVVGYIQIEDIGGQYTFYADINLYPEEWVSGFATSRFNDVSASYIDLTGFYTDERDNFDSNMIWAGTASTRDLAYYQLFERAEMTLERFDPDGITAFYFHIVTHGPTSGKDYDIEVLAVRNFTDEEPPAFIAGVHDLCTACHGSGKCAICGGTGKTSYYDAVARRNQQKDCVVCGGTGVCTICGGSGKRG